METYTHFTSPIRRLCDLVIHHLCKVYVLHTSQTAFNKKQIVSYSTIASDKELIADEAERQIERVMNTIYMKQHVGEEFDGLLIGMNSTSIFIQLINPPISGVLKVLQLKKGKWLYDDRAQRYQNARTSEMFQLMDSVKVRIIQVTDDVYFDLVDEPGTHEHHVSPLTPQVGFSKRKSGYKSGKNKDGINKISSKNNTGKRKRK
jgi:ribonuclease R